jgi:hypothetical protein
MFPGLMTVENWFYSVEFKKCEDEDMQIIIFLLFNGGSRSVSSLVYLRRPVSQLVAPKEERLVNGRIWKEVLLV